MNKFFEALANVFRIPDLRKRVLFTLGLLAVYRMGAFIPTPGIDTTSFHRFFTGTPPGFLGYFNLFSGGMLRRMTIFALGITPYITASIILQLLTVVVPTLDKLQKEGELGRRKITQWTRYLTVGLAIVQSLGIAFALQNSDGNFVVNPGFGFIFMTTLTFTTGTAFIMWLGEQITDRGIGNGMSLIIFVGIVVGLPGAIQNIYTNTFVTHQWNPIQMIMILAVMVAVVAFIVLVERGERRIPVQYAKRVVGRRMMGGQSTHLPLKVNAGGVIPIIFASSLLALPANALQMVFCKDQPVAEQHARSAGRFAAALLLRLRGFDRVLLLLLRLDHLQSERSSGQHAQVRRLHSGHPAGQEYGRIHGQDPFEDHGGGRPVSVDFVDHPANHDLGYQAAAFAVCRELHRRAFPPSLLDGLGVTFYLRRHVAADCGGRSHGYREPDRGAVNHAPL